MPTPESLKAQIESTEDLQSVVKTMKALAAVSIQQYEAAIASLRQYSHTVELGLQILLQQPDLAKSTLPLLQPSAHTERQVGIILFGSDQGLCGQFNQQIAQHLARYLENPPSPLTQQPRLATVGARPIPPLTDQGISADVVMSVPSHVDEITSTVQDLLLLVEHWRREQDCDRLLLFYNRPTSSASYTSTIVQLLPLNPDWLAELQRRPWDNRGLPTILMDEAPLLSKLVRQYLFITLYQAIAASLASENASRLAAMQSAEDNIRDRLTDLTGQYRQQRQSAITAELLDVVSGFEALTH